MKVHELIELLQAYDPEIPVTIVDADTGWDLKITVDAQPDAVFLRPSYDERDNLSAPYETGEIRSSLPMATWRRQYDPQYAGVV